MAKAKTKKAETKPIEIEEDLLSDEPVKDKYVATIVLRMDR